MNDTTNDKLNTLIHNVSIIKTDLNRLVSEIQIFNKLLNDELRDIKSKLDEIEK